MRPAEGLLLNFCYVTPLYFGEGRQPLSKGMKETNTHKALS